MAAIRSVYDNGGVVAGISAGLAAIPWTYMIMGQYLSQFLFSLAWGSTPFMFYPALVFTNLFRLIGSSLKTVNAV